MQMDLGVLYAIVAFVCVAVSAILLDRTISTQFKETVDNSFCYMLIFVIAFSIVDGIWGIYFSNAIATSRLGYIIFTYGFHIMAAWSAFWWFGYAIHFLGLKGRMKIALQTIRFTLITFQMLLIGSNIIKPGFFFVITNDLQYITGKGRKIAFVLQFAYYLFLLVFAFLAYVFDAEKRRQYKNIARFALVPLAFGLGQFIFSDAPMYSIGFMISVLIMYCFNITTERDEYFKELYKKDNLKLTTLADTLAGDFDAIYYIDMQTGEYESFGVNESFGKEFNKLDSTNNFFNDIIGNIGDIVYEEDVAIMTKSMSKKNIIKEFLHKDSFSVNYRMLIDEEQVYYQMRCARSTVEGEENKLVVGIYNIDDDMNRELERQKALENALVAANQANEAKTTFLFNMSHDIRTPMNAIFGFAEIAEKNIGDDDRVRESLSKIKIAGSHLLQLINEVLDMSRVESGKVKVNLEPDDLNNLEERIGSIIGLTASSKGIALNTKIISLPNPKVYIDKLHFSQIMINILSNSVKYTNPGGKVDVTLEQLPSDRNGFADYKFVIADNGIGMSEKFLKELFEPFSREENSTISGIEGTGLGMAITKRMIDVFGGTIDVQSKKGVGTTTTIILPLKLYDKELVASDDTEEEIVALRDIKGKRILIAEDNELNQEIIGEFIEELGLTCDIVGDGEKVVKKLQEADAGTYAAILMDIQMPNMDGYEATGIIRSLPEKDKSVIPIIAMTANAFDEDKQKAYSVGMNAHIGKPIGLDVLENILRVYCL